MDKTGRDNAELDGVLGCEQWEALLADTMDQAATGTGDGHLSPELEEAFARHSLQCPGCGQLMEQARQGQQWLRMLNETRPVPPVDLLSKILARTRGAGTETDFPLGTAAIAGVPGAATPGGRWSMPFLPQASAGLLAMRRAHNARLLMTAAMAFFSVALTLSVAGVKITSVHAAELRPQVMQANVTRSFYGTKKQIVSFYENLRLVYEVESKMQDLRRDVESSPAPAAPQKKPDLPSAAPRPKGSAAIAPGAPAAVTDHKPEQTVRGWPELVSLAPSASRLRPAEASLGDAAEHDHDHDSATTLISGASRIERNRI